MPTISATGNYQEVAVNTYTQSETEKRRHETATQIASQANSRPLSQRAANLAAFNYTQNSASLMEHVGIRYTLNAAWLAEAMVGPTLDFTLQGAPQLELDFVDDPEHQLLNSPLFDFGTNGLLSNVCINYPLGSRYWWVQIQMSPAADYTIKTYWIPLSVYKLMSMKGPKTSSLGSQTQAQFIQSCVAMTNQQFPDTGLPAGAAQRPINFYSRQLNQAQYSRVALTSVAKPRLAAFEAALKPKVAALTSASGSTQGNTTAKNSPGISDAARAHLTVGGQPMTPLQQQNANTIIAEGDGLSAGTKATQAALYAAIGETLLGANPNTFSGTGGSVGVFQSPVGSYSDGHDLQAQAKAWFTGGTWFQDGGGISAAQNQNFQVWQVANAVEANAAWNNYKQDSYAHQWPGGSSQGEKEVQQILNAAGGVGGPGGVSTGLQVGATTAMQIPANTDFWTGINQLAQNVDWEIVVDGDDIYYDSDVTLAQSQIALVLGIDNPMIQNWSYDWDDRHVVTNFQLAVYCYEFDFAPGDVIQLAGGGWGPAALGTTIGLPGRWLISEIQRNAGDPYSTLTLVQPQKPIPQQLVDSTGSTDAAPSGSVEALIGAAQELGAANLPYTETKTGGRVLYENLDVYKRNGWGMDCSMSTIWCLVRAGIAAPGGVTWGGAAGNTETFANTSWGNPGKGQEVTVWLNPSDHVFIEFHGLSGGAGGTYPHSQMNTSWGSGVQFLSGANTPQGGPRYLTWGGNGQYDAQSGGFQPLHL